MPYIASAPQYRESRLVVAMCFFKPRCNGESGLGDAAFHVACTARDDGGFVVLRGNESHPSHSVAGDEFSDFDVGNAKSQRIATRLGVKGGFRAPISFWGLGESQQSRVLVVVITALLLSWAVVRPIKRNENPQSQCFMIRISVLWSELSIRHRRNLWTGIGKKAGNLCCELENWGICVLLFAGWRTSGRFHCGTASNPLGCSTDSTRCSTRRYRRC